MHSQQEGLNPFMNQVYFYTAHGLRSHCALRRVLIPLWIRSISTWKRCWWTPRPVACLNPFMNQVYFYQMSYGQALWGCHKVLIPLWIRSISTRDGDSLNHVVNPRLNPFMNQVYFYDGVRIIKDLSFGLNPFMNQVYFYYSPSDTESWPPLSS